MQRLPAIKAMGAKARLVLMLPELSTGEVAQGLDGALFGSSEDSPGLPGPAIAISKRATQVLFALRRGFVQIDKELFRKTYGVFVRSPLEYAVQAWHPLFKKDYLQLSRVQARATKMVKNLSHLPYEARLVKPDLFPLNYRQLRGDLTQTYRIVRGRECALEFAYFFELAGTKHLRGHPFKLQRKFVHTEFRWNAFSQRVIGAWNGLTDEVVL
ncbi:unnamed protein product [Schistocephalus solidus]|uniref:TIGR04255 family protein n=1 Tax=Schistocephalus solidus TaxID=70667 RepID=A0A183TMF0_SCHSO|nr:unnamed protein product [Schistocephalus solidus]